MLGKSKNVCHIRITLLGHMSNLVGLIIQIDAAGRGRGKGKGAKNGGSKKEGGGAKGLSI